MTCDNDQRCKIVAMLFGAYGQGSDETRIAIYAKLLEDLPVAVLSKSVKKLVLEQKFLPSVSEIVEAAQSLMGSVDDSSRIKSWAEAWGEIERACLLLRGGKLRCLVGRRLLWLLIVTVGIRCSCLRQIKCQL